MNILIISQYFWPEEFRINDLAEGFLQRGNKVTVLTGKPNYPQGKIFSGYQFWGIKKEKYKGIDIIRVPLIPRKGGRNINLIMNYLSYVFFSCSFILFHKEKYDITLTFATSPITQAYAGVLHKALYGSKAFIWVQDLWPESILALGKIKEGVKYKILNIMVESIYRKCDKILIQSEGFYDSIIQKGVDSEKIRYIPNWADDIFSKKEIINKFKYKTLIPDGFIIMFAGNIGKAQDFDSIIESSILIKKKTKNVKWVVVGDGSYRKQLENKIRKNALEDVFFLLGRFPSNEMPNFFIHANLMLISLKNEEIFSLTIPSKLQSYMASGKPILSMLNGITNKIIEEADCGYTAMAGDFNSLAKNIIKAYDLSLENLEKIGVNGEKYYNLIFEKERIIDKLCLCLEE
jgi:glycosyltransferase involved in cell wall biosynthesis